MLKLIQVGEKNVHDSSLTYHIVLVYYLPGT